jgi:hypothetical protein
VIEELPGAPVEQIAQALVNRGWCHYDDNHFAGFLSEIETALSKNPSSKDAALIWVWLCSPMTAMRMHLKHIGVPESAFQKKLRTWFICLERGQEKMALGGTR